MSSKWMWFPGDYEIYLGYFASPNDPPVGCRFRYKIETPVAQTETENGVLYDFGRETFLDGIKRDRWYWSGDATESYLMNFYSFFDGDVNRRTMWAIRGKDPVEAHLNLILDYSLYWLISLYDHHRRKSEIVAEKGLKRTDKKRIICSNFSRHT